MRVTFLSTVHPHPWSPTKGTFNQTMLEGLLQHAEVRAIVPVPWPEQIRARQGAPNTRYPVVSARFNYVPILDRLALARRMTSGLKTVLAREPVPDVILTYWTDPDGTAALAWGKRIGRPVVQIAGGSDVLLLTHDPKRRARIAATLQQMNSVLAIGNGVRDAVVGLGVPEARVHVVSRGVDRSRFHPLPKLPARTKLGLPADRRLLLWVGRMVHVKGLDILLQALAGSDPSSHDVGLLLVGDGPLRRQLENLSRRLGIQDRVTFVGAVAHHDLPDWYAASDRVVLPSRSEGVPNVLLEGMACGRNFFASRVGGVAELASHQDVLLPVGDALAWAAQITAWARTPDVAGTPIAVPDHAEAAIRLAELLNAVAGSSRPG